MKECPCRAVNCSAMGNLAQCLKTKECPLAEKLFEEVKNEKEEKEKE